MIKQKKQFGYRIMLNSLSLISLYSKFKRNPNRVFIRRDFLSDTPSIRSHLKVLQQLDLIELVPVKYYCGAKYRNGRRIKGYRLIKQRKLKKDLEELQNAYNVAILEINRLKRKIEMEDIINKL